MGGREVGGLANMLACHLDIENADHRAAVHAFWESPRMAAAPGMKAVEMFEAVGQEYWDTFAERVARLLKPDGMAGLQVITIDEQAFDAYRARPDFIQQYVFPGGMLPTVTHLRELFARHGLRVADLYRFGQDYATTLRMWRERFAANWQSICEEGFDERFFRMWNYYLAYCEAAFRVGRTDVVQLRLERI